MGNECAKEKRIRIEDDNFLELIKKQSYKYNNKRYNNWDDSQSFNYENNAHDITDMRVKSPRNQITVHSKANAGQTQQNETYEKGFTNQSKNSLNGMNKGNRKDKDLIPIPKSPGGRELSPVHNPLGDRVVNNPVSLKKNSAASNFLEADLPVLNKSPPIQNLNQPFSSSNFQPKPLKISPYPAAHSPLSPYPSPPLLSSVQMNSYSAAAERALSLCPFALPACPPPLSGLLALPPPPNSDGELPAVLPPLSELPVLQCTSSTTYRGLTLASAKHYYGEEITPEGSGYRGTYWMGQWHGEGLLVCSDGTLCLGTFIKGKASGYARVWKPSDSISEERLFEGTLTEGFAQGKGRARWANNTRFEGEWVQGEALGYGTLWFCDGALAKGRFRKGALDGELCEIRWNDKVQFEGEVKMNTLVKGTLKSEGEFIYIGEFKKGKFSGRGHLIRPNGNVYEGYFKDGKPHGYGVFFNEQKKLKKLGYWENGIRKRWEKTVKCDYRFFND